MNRLSTYLIVFAVLLISQTAWALPAPHIWSQRFGDTAYQGARGIAIDDVGNIVSVGFFSGTVDFGGDTLTSAGVANAFVAKYDRNGDHIWSKGFGHAGEQVAWCVALDLSGNILVAGEFTGSVDFGGDTLTSAGGYDVFVAKFDADGNHMWSHRFGDGFSQEAKGIGVDEYGYVYVTGIFGGTIDFGGGTLTSAGGYDVFLASFLPDGSHRWSQRYGDTFDQDVGGLAVSDTRKIFITGSFLGTINFGGGALGSAGMYDIFIARFSDTGVYGWSQRYGDANMQIATGVDATTDIVVTGVFEGTVNFGGGALTSAGGWDVYVARFNESAAHVWSSRFGDAGQQEGYGVDLHATGVTSLVGSFQSTVDFGIGGPLVSAGGYDIFLARFSAGGGALTAMGFGDSSDQLGIRVATDPQGNTVITGDIAGIVDFGGGPLPAGGSHDVFLASYHYAVEPFITSIEDIGNDQGRSARLTFIQSSYDASGSSTTILQYEAFRRIDPLPSSPAMFLDTASDFDDMMSNRSVLLDGWDYVGAVPAHGEFTYNMIVPTLSDSTITDGMHWSGFFVRATTSDPLEFFDSFPDSGYSVDNLAPHVPSSFTVAYMTGNGNALSWDEPLDADFQYFRVYRDDEPDFTPSPDNLVHMTIGTQWSDTEYDGWKVYYKITAVDFSGNESDAAYAGTMTDIPDRSVPRQFALYPNVPNPFNPSTRIRYDVPAGGGHVSLVVYDVSGRRIRTLVDRIEEPGEKTVVWDGKDHRGSAVSTGVYFYRFVTEGFSKTHKMVLIK